MEHGVCAAYYGPLHLLEVGFRNRVHSALMIRHGARWYEGSGELSLNPFQEGCVREAKRELERMNRSDHPDSIVAELSFGFWTSLLTRQNERLWHGLLKHVFPGARGEIRQRAIMAQRFADLRQFRNKIFHHERILHHPLQQRHEELLEAIGWLDPNLAMIAVRTNRVNRMITHGFADCQATACDLMGIDLAAPDPPLLLADDPALAQSA